MIVFGSAIVFGAGLRPGFSDFSPWQTWGTSVGFLLAAYFCLVLVVRESTPGIRLPLSLWALSLTLLVLAQVAYAVSIHLRAPFAVPSGEELRFIVPCLIAVSGLGVALVLAAASLCRWGILGTKVFLLASVPAVVAADAIWRLHCPFTNPAHFLAGHLGAIASLATGVSLAAWGIQRRRRV